MFLFPLRAKKIEIDMDINGPHQYDTHEIADVDDSSNKVEKELRL